MKSDIARHDPIIDIQKERQFESKVPSFYLQLVKKIPFEINKASNKKVVDFYWSYKTLNKESNIMQMIFISGLVGFSIAVVIFIIFWIFKLKYSAPGREIRIHASLEKLRSVGELVVFKIITKEIVTTSKHWLGEKGKKYFQWLVSTKKMAMIFEFDIDFRYDLRSPDFTIHEEGEKKYRLKMPQCFYEVHIRDISFYDEQNAKFLPWLLPDLINRAFGSGFNEEDKNLLIEEAKYQATQMADNLVRKMRSEVQNSARQTLEALSKNFGAEKVLIDFTDSKLIQSKVSSFLLEEKVKK